MMEKFSINAGIFEKLMNSKKILESNAKWKGIEKFNQGSLWHKRKLKLGFIGQKKFDWECLNSCAIEASIIEFYDPDRDLFIFIILFLSLLVMIAFLSSISSIKKIITWAWGMNDEKNLSLN